MDYKELREMAYKAKYMVGTLKTGYVFNPLLKYPVNNKCPCGSGKKWKKCCRDKIERAIPEDQSKEIINKLKGIKQ